MRSLLVSRRPAASQSWREPTPRARISPVMVRHRCGSGCCVCSEPSSTVAPCCMGPLWPVEHNGVSARVRVGQRHDAYRAYDVGSNRIYYICAKDGEQSYIAAHVAHFFDTCTCRKTTIDVENASGGGVRWHRGATASAARLRHLLDAKVLEPPGFAARGQRGAEGPPPGGDPPRRPSRSSKKAAFDEMPP